VSDSTQKIVRFVGIDFGTSTSAIFFKDYYADGRPCDPGDAEPVMFGKAPTVSTVVLTDPEGYTHYGEEAEARKEDYPDLLRSEFKMDLLKTEDPELSSRAEKLTRTFLEHLHETYRRQTVTIGDARVLEEQALISYPAKWPGPVRQMMVEAAEKAGFKNARGMLEPEAAMRYFSSIRTSEYEKLERRGIITEGRALNVLLIDMGAGTTDLVLYRYVPGEEIAVQTFWPPVDRAERGRHLGGREIDEQLFARVIESALPEGWLESLGEEWVADWRQKTKVWKETVLSPELLKDDGRVDYLPAFITRQLRRERHESPKINLDRKRFESLFGDYLRALSSLIDELIDRAKSSRCIEGGEDIDLIILTGGHSQWYFVEEMLADKRAGVRGPSLRTIHKEPDRILKGPHPQQTVARGMALSGMPVRVSRAAANNAWLKIKLGEKEIEPIQIQSAGDRLPTSKQLYSTVDYNLPSFDATMAGRCTVVVGEQLAQGKEFKPIEFTVPYKSFLERVIKRVISGDTAHIYLDIRIDEEERFTVLGVVQPTWGKGAGHIAINRKPPKYLERQKLAEAMKQHIGDQ
jgi:molecular chaperone DnaK (HSP70)